jgi:hypothetical protein
MDWLSGIDFGLYPAKLTEVGYLKSVIACRASFAISTSTGPGRPELAI